MLFRVEWTEVTPITRICVGVPYDVDADAAFNLTSVLSSRDLQAALLAHIVGGVFHMPNELEPEEPDGPNELDEVDEVDEFDQLDELDESDEPDESGVFTESGGMASEDALFTAGWSLLTSTRPKLT
jgi:hypothetical protein